MAVLPNADRVRVHRGLMRYWSDQREATTAMLKADIRAAVNAADDWAEANAASYNTALPAAFRTNATTAQKAILLAVVITARFAPAFVQQLLGLAVD